MTRANPTKEPFEKPSRSARKREARALQDMGERLAKLPPEELSEIPLPDDLKEAIAICPKLPGREAKRRQRQYIGRLMRDLDQDICEKIARAVKSS